jgi:hypothetical protein
MIVQYLRAALYTATFLRVTAALQLQLRTANDISGTTQCGPSDSILHSMRYAEYVYRRARGD